MIRIPVSKKGVNYAKKNIDFKAEQEILKKTGKKSPNKRRTSGQWGTDVMHYRI